jgi:PAS domain-containing protein
MVSVEAAVEPRPLRERVLNLLEVVAEEQDASGWLKRLTEEAGGWCSTRDYVLAILAAQRAAMTKFGPVSIGEDAAQVFADLVAEALEDDCRPGEALEATSQGFAEIDRNGVVRKHNVALAQLVGRSSLAGECIFDWFGAVGAGDSAANDVTLANRVSRIWAVGGGAIRHRDVSFCGSDREVKLEVCIPTREDSGRAYLFVTETTVNRKAQEEVFAKAEFGVARFGRDGKMLFCNKYLADRLGGKPERLVGNSLGDLAFDRQAGRAAMDAELEKRRRGEPSIFVLKTQVDGAAPRSIRVAASPEFDEDGTTRIATLAFVRMIEPEQICRNIHERLAGIVDVYAAIETIHELIKPLVPHDMLTFSIFDDTGAWSMPLHTVPSPKQPWKTRWFPISTDLVQWTFDHLDPQYGTVHIPDIREFHEATFKSNPLAKDPTVRAIISGETLSSLSVPVFQGERLIASLSLMRACREFEMVEAAFVATMQLRETALNLSFQYHRQEQDFLDGLNRAVTELLAISGSSIAAKVDCARNAKVAELITRSLAEFYRWRAVEIFEVDRTHDAYVRLAACEWTDTGVSCTEPQDSVTPPKSVAAAYAKGEIQRYAPERDEPTSFASSHDWAQSAISLPLKVDGRVVWIINVEDDRLDAMNKQEETKLTAFVEHTQSALERLYTESLFGAVFTNASDIIFVVDENGRVYFANERAARVTGFRSPDELAGHPLAELLLNPSDATCLLGGPVREVRCAFRAPASALEKPRYALARAAALPNAFGLRVVYATELDMQSWHADVQVIEGAIAQAAQQSNKSMMYVFDMIRRLPESVPGLAAQKQRVEKHLSDVKLTYDRIRKHLPSDAERYEGVDLAALPFAVARTLAPGEEPDAWIELAAEAAPFTVIAAPDDVAFVVRSILDYLRRRKADVAPVRVALTTEAGGASATLTISAETGPPPPAPLDPFVAAFEAGAQMVTLASGALRRIVEEQHGGRFHYGRSAEGGTEIFTLTLPRTPDWRDYARAR